MEPSVLSDHGLPLKLVGGQVPARMPSYGKRLITDLSNLSEDLTLRRARALIKMIDYFSAPTG